MASIQSRMIKFWIRRLNLFRGDHFDPLPLRERIEKVSRHAKPRRGVRLLPVDAGGVPAEMHIPKGAPEDCAVLYLHGGAWCICSPRNYRRFASGLALLCGVRMLVIDYRLAPEHPFPAALEDCITAYEWLLWSGIPAEKIVVAGDSAGGNLTLALLVALKDAGKPLPAGAAGLSPAADLSPASQMDPERKRRDPYFSKMGNNNILPDYLGGNDPCNPLISPIYADLRGLPPLLLHAGEHEILADDIIRFGERAAADGVDVRTVVWPQMFHVFHMYMDFMPEARRASQEIAAFVRARLNRNETG